MVGVKVYTRPQGQRYVSFRGLPARDVLLAHRVPAMYTAISGFNVRRERVPDVVAMFEDAGHRVVWLGGGDR